MLKAFTLLAAIVLFASCSNKKTKEVTASSPFQASPLDSAYAPLRPAVQRFTIDNSKVNSIQARNGTEVLIPADCFTRANGEKAEKVDMEIVEALSLPDFVSSGLITLSDGRLLLSNGMMYINARTGNEVLQLKEGTSLTVSMPT
ncbi:MAG TPA: hypothetical protein VNT20_04205, partial [Flavisolibacter sp.]|nr:hypothetical protein [Flavisolibacter sp.]